MKVARSLSAVALAVLLGLPSIVNAGSIKVLFLGAEDDPALVDAVKTDILGTDSRFDLTNSSSWDTTFLGNPSLATLNQYDAVLAWTNRGVGVGYADLLADYVDAGGHLVLSTFHGQEIDADGFGGAGRIDDTGYNPLTDPDTNAYTPGSLGAYDSSSPFMDGVTSLSAATYRGDYFAGLDAGATLVASWDDGKPLLAVNGAGNVVAVTLFPSVIGYGHASGDYQQLFRNALAVGVQGSAVPEPSTFAGAAIAALGLFALKRRRNAD